MDVAEASRFKLEETDIFCHGQGQGEGQQRGYLVQ